MLTQYPKECLILIAAYLLHGVFGKKQFDSLMRMRGAIGGLRGLHNRMLWTLNMPGARPTKRLRTHPLAPGFLNSEGKIIRLPCEEPAQVEVFFSWLLDGREEPLFIHLN